MYFHTLTRCLAATGFWNDCLQEDDARQLCKLKFDDMWARPSVLTAHDRRTTRPGRPESLDDRSLTAGCFFGRSD